MDKKRNFLAALDATSGAASSWNPSINRIINYGFDPSSIKALSVSARTVYVGGSFDRIGEEFQSNFARFDTTSTLVTPIRPRATEIQPDRLTWTWDDTTDAKIGFKVWADPGANAAATLCTTTTATSWVYSGLTPNVPYTFQVTAFSASDESVCTDAYTTFTLAAAPTDGQNVTGTQMTETPRPLGASFLFTNPLGFGPGSHGGGIYAVSAFRWVWDENPTCAFGGGESVWAIDELVCTPTPRRKILSAPAIAQRRRRGHTANPGPGAVRRDHDQWLAKLANVPLKAHAPENNPLQKNRGRSLTERPRFFVRFICKTRFSVLHGRCPARCSRPAPRRRAGRSRSGASWPARRWPQPNWIHFSGSHPFRMA